MKPTSAAEASTNSPLTAPQPSRLSADDLYVDFRTITEATLAAAQERYEKWGCFVAGGLLTTELASIRYEAGRLIELAIGQTGGAGRCDQPARFDEGFAELEARSAAAATAVCDAARRLTSVHQLSVHPQLLTLARRLMGTDLVMSSPYKPVRIDYSRRQERLLPWHQDYPYAQDSLDALVCWIPLQPVDDRNGCLLVAPGSHRSGIYPVDVLVYPSGAKALRLSDERVADGSTPLSIPMSDGDMLVFSALLLHRSQLNTTADIRWTVQIRLGNFAHPVAVQKLWPRGHYERHWFDDTHPEHVTEVVRIDG